jgi:hypothetical protein
MVAPFTLGGLLAVWLWKVPGLFSEKATQFEAVVFLGAALSITAFPMLARIIYERGITGTSLGTLALAAGAINAARLFRGTTAQTAGALSRDLSAADVFHVFRIKHAARYREQSAIAGFPWHFLSVRLMEIIRRYLMQTTCKNMASWSSCLHDRSTCSRDRADRISRCR